MGVGGTFDFVAGEQTRAPVWVQRAGFEWLYRLIREPRRIKRQMALPRFVARVMLESIGNSEVRMQNSEKQSDL
jgi:N-acetylglucosaminyldiphosphoundecaprenol N-acetyl-beta-D-mannosaminyltransferase